MRPTLHAKRVKKHVFSRPKSDLARETRKKNACFAPYVLHVIKKSIIFAP